MLRVGPRWPLWPAGMRTSARGPPQPPQNVKNPAGAIRGAKAKPLPEGYDMNTQQDQKPTAAEKRQAVIDAHRHVASLLEEHDALPHPIVHHNGLISWRLWSWECPEGVPSMVAMIRRVIGGKWEKVEREQGVFTDPEMVFSHPGYEVVVKREAVCTRRVVGTTSVVKPAISLPERTETTEIVEWDCHPVLAEVSA